MSPWANEFADWRREMEPGSASGSPNTEDVNGLEETRGCAVLDSGATVMCSSTVAAETSQQQRIDRAEPGEPTVSESDRRFKFVDGRVDEAGKVVEQPVTSGLLAGRTLSMHLIDKEGNDTCPLLSINDIRRLRMVVDYEESKVVFKDSPTCGTNFQPQRKAAC